MSDVGSFVVSFADTGIKMQFNDIKALVADDFQAVDALITENLQSPISIIHELGNYIIQSGGKRIRPLVVLLIAKACGYQGTHHISLAAIVELVHTATLLHDDVVDEAELRRNRQTANRVWGNVASILVGDYIYSRAFQILTDIVEPNIMKVMANATTTMAEGEALQLLDRKNEAITEGAYLTIIRSKTAKLFEAAAEFGALLTNSTAKIKEACKHYGMHLGTAFQLIDDVLDYTASPIQTGKKIGNDLLQGKITLPLIHVLQTGSHDQIHTLREIIKNPREEQLNDIQKIIEDGKGIEYTMDYARKEVSRAQKALLSLPENSFRAGAHALAQFALERSN